MLLFIYGFVATTFIYGLIMDTSTLLMSVSEPTMAALTAVYISGIVFNVIHGLSTVVILWFLAESMFRKLDRIKQKYGMYIS